MPKIPRYRGDTFLFDPHLWYVGDAVACVAAKVLLDAEPMKQNEFKVTMARNLLKNLLLT